MTSFPGDGILGDTADPAAAFLDALTGLDPDRLTACAGWTVHDLVVHMVSGSEEILRHLTPALAGDPIPATRSFDESEELWRQRSLCGCLR